jgi:hypothetical protein
MLGRDQRTVHRTLLLLVALAVVFVAGCLAPDAADPTGRAPVGRLEAVFADGDGIRVRGWAADPDLAAPVVVTMSSEQRSRTFVADVVRDDVGRRGFDARFPGLAPGLRQICVWVDDVGPGREGRLLGCREVTVGPVQPTGVLEVVAPGGVGRISVGGWAYEHDRPGPAEVAVTVDGRFADRRPTTVARPDVAAFLGRPPEVGFAVDLPATPGPRRVCVVVVNSGYGTDSSLGCREVVVAGPPQDRRPVGRVTSVVPVDGGVVLSGLGSDPDGPLVAARVRVVGGATVDLPVAAGAFSATIPLAVGPARFCVELVDVPGPPGAASGDRTLPCSTAVVAASGSVSVGTSGSPSSTAPVGPPSTSPLAGIDRDAGVSAVLRDGSVLWLFGDSSAVDANGSLRYFVNNTAAWAAPGALTVTRDGASAGRPVPFATPVDGFPACPADAPWPGMWPMSAVVRSDGPLDRVVVLTANVCLGASLRIVPAGVSVVTWDYDPTRPPVDVPVTGTVVEQLLFAPGEPLWGTSAVLGADGVVHAYACGFPPDGGTIDQYGPCRVARVPVDSVADRTAWEFWAGGTDWSTDQTAAVALDLPDGPDGTSPPMPGFSVKEDPVHGVVVMAYSPWPGFTDRVQVRVAPEATGPWSAPVEVHLPGCADSVSGTLVLCYAGTAQPSFSRPGLLGLGYYDQRIRVDAAGGQYVTIEVPFSVVVVP